MWVRRCGICRKPGGEEWGQALLIPQQGRAEQRLLPMHRVRWCKTQNPVRAAVRGSAANGSGNKNRARNSLAVADGAGGAVQDYLECLHHRKEIARMNTILQEAKRQDDAASGVRHSHRPPPSPPPLSLSCARTTQQQGCVMHTHTAHASFCAPATARGICASFTRISVWIVWVDDTAMSACVFLIVYYPCASRPCPPSCVQKGAPAPAAH